VFKTAFSGRLGFGGRLQTERLCNRGNPLLRASVALLGLVFFRLAVDCSSRSSPESMGFGEAVQDQVYRSVRQENME
jgi:hypothetical protein